MGISLGTQNRWDTAEKRRECQKGIKLSTGEILCLVLVEGKGIQKNVQKETRTSFFRYSLD